MSQNHLMIEEDNLSVAWARLFLEIKTNAGFERSPIFVSVTMNELGEPNEDFDIKSALDAELKIKKTKYEKKLSPTDTIANTIFPINQWLPHKDKELLYRKYMTTWPLVKKDTGNTHGTYFNRLISFSGNLASEEINQLDKIIDTWKHYKSKNKYPRRSALQASIFDPRKDHTRGPMLGFPCMQQVAFTPDGNGGLIVSGFYAMQYVFEKAYGNYLGLSRLGVFMAHELGLKLVRLNVLINVGKLEYPKSSMDSLHKKIASILKENS